MANVGFVWHMHQPYYVNPVSRLAMMPWVRLHAVKGYLDMITILADFPGVRVNFNLTPVLLLQIDELVHGRTRDLWFEWSRKPAVDLEEHERLAILEHFFKIHHANLLHPFPRYAELFAKRGPAFYRDRARSELRYWSTEDFRDLQTWFNLAWCGYSAERLFPDLQLLKKKGRLFTESDKLRVLDIHTEILRRIIPLYAAAEERGQVELTTTPFFHPILPLVYDSDFAERCMPGRSRPHRFHWPQDARAHLEKAVQQHQRMFGRPPRGLWPSEGSVAPELVPLMQEVGIQYFCTDEEILFRSLENNGEHADRLDLFQGWRVEFQGASVNAVFREKPLSDFIGFMSYRNEPKQSAGHLLTRFRHICDHLQNERELIPVILDGENCWENFRDGGEAFLRELYGALEEDPHLRATTLEDYFRRCPPARTISRLHTASWIQNNFDIWIGDDEENRAWDLLGSTREFLEKKQAQLEPTTRENAFQEIYAAEGSDWFWWYGPDFSTECDFLFDDLFRQHLKNVYSLCGEIPPPSLDHPIIGGESVDLHSRPRCLLTVNVNGRATPYFEWVGAGHYRAGSEQGAMFRDDRFIRDIYFGADATTLFLRCDTRRVGPFQVAVIFQRPAGVIALTPKLGRGRRGKLSVIRDGTANDLGEYAVEDIVELAIPWSALYPQPAELPNTMQFRVKILFEGLERECYPESAPIELNVPGSDASLANWIV